MYIKKQYLFLKGVREVLSNAKHSCQSFLQLCHTTLPGGTQSIPRPYCVYNSSSMFWFFHRVQYVNRIPPKGGVQYSSSSDDWTTSTGSFLHKAAVLLQAPIMSELLTLSQIVGPAILRRKLTLTTCLCRLIWLITMTIVKGWNTDWLVNQEPSFQAEHLQQSGNMPTLLLTLQ